jgi:tRNA (guanosine-2'-O-)-methyltransferase
MRRSKVADINSVSSSDLVKVLSQQVTPERWQKTQAVVDQRVQSMSVVIENIFDRGNASAVMRSMEAFGFYKIHMIEISEKFKESQRVTKGAEKWLEIRKWKSTKACIEELKAQGQKIYVTHLDKNAKPLEDIDVSSPFALCFGNEKDGASQELIDLADETVFIPMRGFVQSFNISVAAAVACYGLLDKLKASGEELISPAEKERLTAFYLTQSVENWDLYMKNR